MSRTAAARPVNVVCIKWGTSYPPHYVNRLYHGVRRFLSRPFRFLCFTEHPEGIDPAVEIHPLPVEPFDAVLDAAMARRGALRKVSLFRPGLADMEGRVLGFDIDVVVTGSLDELVDFSPGKVCMRREWRYEPWGREGGHGSVFLYDPARHGYLYEDFAADPVGAIRRHRSSEQLYTSMTALRHGDLEYLPGQWVCSFKFDALRPPPFNRFVAPRLPADCRVLCFHGRPKMEEAIDGYRFSLLEAAKPAPWLGDYWIGEER
jgi:hypothetical protein